MFLVNDVHLQRKNMADLVNKPAIGTVEVSVFRALARSKAICGSWRGLAPSIPWRKPP